MHGGHARRPGRMYLLEPVEEAQRIEPWRDADLRSRGQRGEDAGDQPVDVEERHDLQADVRRRERERAGDVARRGGQVRLRERDQLGPRRGAARMQKQREVVGLPGAGRLRPRAERGRPFQAEAPRTLARLRMQLDDGNGELRGHLARRRVDARLDDQRLRPQIAQIEVELVLPVAGIEGRRGDTRGHASESRPRLRPVAQQDGDAISAADPHGVERVYRAGSEIAQAAPGEGLRLRRADGGRGVGAARQLRQDGVRVLHAFALSTPGFRDTCPTASSAFRRCRPCSRLPAPGRW